MIIAPLYVDCDAPPPSLPYGLRVLHGIYWSKRRPVTQLMPHIDAIMRRRTGRRISAGRLPRREREAIENKRRALAATRKRLERRVDEALARELPSSLLFVDVDGFEQINRKHGRLIADHVIDTVHRVFGRVIERASCWRGWGDQLLGYLTVPEKQAGEIADELRQAVEAYPWSGLHAGLYARISVGVAERKEEEPTDNWLIRGILGARHAKRIGGNRVCFGPYDLPPDVGEPEEHLS